MTARARILSLIRERQGKAGEPAAHELETVRSYLAAHRRNAAPRDAWEPLARFRERAVSLASSVDEAQSLVEVPVRVARYLAEQGLPLQAICWPELGELDWAAAGISTEVRGARGDDLVGITGAFCAISETGTLMLLSGPTTPPSVSLLPETHIAVLRRERVVRAMEDAWALLRHDAAGMPRAVTFVSGPSRTADIEQTVTMGAHGPYRVHIILV